MKNDSYIEFDSNVKIVSKFVKTLTLLIFHHSLCHFFYNKNNVICDGTNSINYLKNIH